MLSIQPLPNRIGTDYPTDPAAGQWQIGDKCPPAIGRNVPFPAERRIMPKATHKTVAVMGIRFYCPQGHKLNVKEFQAGRSGVCPYCGAKVQIPTESTRSSSRRKKSSPDETPAVEPTPDIEAAPIIIETAPDDAESTDLSPASRYEQRRAADRAKQYAMAGGLAAAIVLLFIILLLVLVNQ